MSVVGGTGFPSIFDLVANPVPDKTSDLKKASAPRYAEEERDRVKRRISGFDWKHSVAWQELTAHFGAILNHN